MDDELSEYALHSLMQKSTDRPVEPQRVRRRRTVDPLARRWRMRPNLCNRQCVRRTSCSTTIKAQVAPLKTLTPTRMRYNAATDPCMMVVVFRLVEDPRSRSWHRIPVDHMCWHCRSLGTVLSNFTSSKICFPLQQSRLNQDFKIRLPTNTFI